MNIEAHIQIASPIAEVWGVVTDFPAAESVYSDIRKIEVIEQPSGSLIGFKWKEVREFMGKEAEETMWIIEANEGSSYTSEARNSGCLYHSGISLKDLGGTVEVTKWFKATPESIFAKLMMPLMYLMKGPLRKCIDKDLSDLKTFIEAKG